MVRKRTITIILLLMLAAALLGFSLKRPSSVGGEITWGITFSHVFAEELGFDWKEVYVAILDELKPTLLRLPVYWQVVEPEKGTFHFDEYDFMLDEAQKRGVNVVLVIGRRVPRWPECHIPRWAQKDSEGVQQENVRAAIFETVERYKHFDVLSAWQVENEPFLPYFGECPFPDGAALDKEIAFVRFLDPSRPIMVTDSGELSTWLPAAKRADIFGTTMYRTVWSDRLSPYLGYITYPLPPKFFWLKANLVHLFYGADKPIIVSELQAEPWTPGSLKGLSSAAQQKSMSVDKFHENIAYARAVGFPEVYLWGAEWWYLMKEEYDQPEFWEAGKEVIATSPR